MELHIRDTQYQDQIRQSLEQRPVRTIAEACKRIAELTGVVRKPTQVVKFLKRMGLKFQRVRIDGTDQLGAR